MLQYYNFNLGRSECQKQGCQKLGLLGVLKFALAMLRLILVSEISIHYSIAMIVISNFRC